tara:strand:- start:724 stop:1119 length:396 start_codon:yes stop_codon:yes gene_type:complete
MRSLLKATLSVTANRECNLAALGNSPTTQIRLAASSSYWNGTIYQRFSVANFALSLLLIRVIRCRSIQFAFLRSTFFGLRIRSVFVAYTKPIFFPFECFTKFKIQIILNKSDGRSTFAIAIKCSYSTFISA